MWGSIIGDIAGSVYEFVGCKRADVDLFSPGAQVTDDSVLSIATASVLLKADGSYADAYRKYGRTYPDPMGGYGIRFRHWLFTDNAPPYHSWGNGSAMRVGPIGWAFDRLEDTLAEAQMSAEVTHNHPEGVKGAQAVAAAVYWARTGKSREEIREGITRIFGYDLTQTVDQIRPNYHFDESCQGTVPQALTAFLDSGDFEEAIRFAVSLGGDADTLACITGSVAEAFYREIPEEMMQEARVRLEAPLSKIVEEFGRRFVRR